MSDDGLLEVRDLHKYFGGVTAVDGFDMTVERNSITGLIGPNGAGKTTVFRTISGFHDPDGGKVVFDGEEITGKPVYEIVEAGITRTFQEARTFPEMTVFENLLVGKTGHRGEKLLPATAGPKKYAEDERAAVEHADQLLGYMELAEKRDQRADQLAVGERKLLEIARALMTNPDLILLDEPMAGLPSDLTTDIVGYIERIREERDQTFLIVEHDMDTIMNICDSITVMEAGQTIASGTPEEVRNDERVVEAYLGEESA
ncbi:ABC transporter ATP-binding protein [Halorubrum sp. SD690R]|uniref:ABC transporter ATP-binding protein n=1 Tax=Halorubrum sp. SD690R TaxID=2518117 RepID=UPI0010F8271A|nr:ABC transporter ATP-binding protein [Halorubrum sp. SD690R]TKX43639.1 ABC transporter ATP-binding protein [Halorubrum sp. SD690R]